MSGGWLLQLDVAPIARKETSEVAPMSRSHTRAQQGHSFLAATEELRRGNKATARCPWMHRWVDLVAQQGRRLGMAGAVADYKETSELLGGRAHPSCRKTG